MAGLILATKLHQPRPRTGLVARPRLRERLRRGAESRLTVVCAPAGFGKTTLLADWAADWSADWAADQQGETAAEDRRVAWLSLDPADGEPASFWTYLVTALQGAVPGLGESALELVASSPLPTELMLTTLLNELAELNGLNKAATQVWLVLDDYHVVDGPEIAAGMTFLLEHLPPNAHIVISARADPELPLARWRARAELTEVRAADLRFTPDEASAYLAGVSGLDLAAADVAALTGRTEGWIAALQLAALSIQGRDDAAGLIARFAGDDRYVVDYLVEEVLRHQPAPVRDFLLQTSVLDRFTAPLCDAVTGRDDGGELLRAVERANLFLVPLDDRREWYRYHHLFADVLRARLLAEQPDLVPWLHQRASQWCERHDLADEAIGHALAARDVDRAARLIELSVPAIRRDRREATLRGWLESLPQDVVRRSPVLSVFGAYLHLVAGDLDAAQARLDDAERALPAAADETLPATIAIHRASLAQARGDLVGTAAHARRALDLAAPGDHLARGGAAGFLGIVAWAQGDAPGAVQTFTQAVASLHAAGNLVDALNSTVTLADMWLAAGRPDTARRLYDQALQLAQEHGDAVLSATVDLHVGISELDVEDGDLAGAHRHLERATVLGRRVSRAESRYRWFVASSQVAVAEGDPQQAVTLLDQAERLYRPGFFPDVRPIAAIRARVWIGQGNLAQAADWARERGVCATDEVGYLHEFDHLTLVRLLIAQHREHPEAGTLDQANGLLDRLLAAAETSGRGGSVREIRLLQELAADARGHALSHRELQVLRLLDSELTGPQIARELFVSHNTLRTHTKHIFTKLAVTSRRAAVRRAREQGML